MQKKIRLRVLLMIWGLMLLFLTALCSSVAFYLYQTAVTESEQALKTAVETDSVDNETIGMLAVRLNQHGKAGRVTQSRLSLSDDALNALLTKIKPEKELTLYETESDGVRYRYMGKLTRGEMWVAVAECTHEQNMAAAMKRNVMVFILVGFVLLIPFSLLLSRWVTRPMEMAWEKQNDFVSDATHELKTPLTVIATNAEAVLANSDRTVESQEKWLDSIQGETGRMANLVANLLFLAKVDAGEIHLEREDIRISDMIEGMCIERESDLFEEEKLMEYDMTPGLIYQGDRKRIEQMMTELLNNAAKYTKPGGSIRVIVNRDKKQNLRIVISNTGKELTEEELSKVFDRFYRVDPSRARATGGYGLGLCVARSIAELHNGTITADSGNGMNVFTVLLGYPEETGRKSHKKHK